MLELLAIILLILVLVFYLKNKNRNNAPKHHRRAERAPNKGHDVVIIGAESADDGDPDDETESVTYSYSESDYNDDVDTGKITATNDGYCLNPNSPLPLSFTNMSSDIANEIKQIFDADMSYRGRDSQEELVFFFTKYNIKCAELEEFVNNSKKEINELIEKTKNSSNEWRAASEKDREDLLREFRQNAIEKMSIKPSDIESFSTLLFDAPKNEVVDAKLMGVFGDRRDLYAFYVRLLQYENRIFKVAADHYDRKRWESLNSIGLAKRGKEIPVEMLLDSLRMKDLNDLFSARINKKFAKKAQAVEFAAAQADVLDVLSKHISFREMFQVMKHDGVDASEIEKHYGYTKAKVEIIGDTYQTGRDTLSAIKESKECKFEGWRIDAEDCCDGCSKLYAKTTKSKPRKLPPFHIGCTCTVEEDY